MPIDTPTIRLDWRPTARVFRTDPMKERLDALAKEWPEYQPVVHLKLGTADLPVAGYVRTDSAASVPWTFDGRPRRVCVGPGEEVWVSVIWHPATAFPKRAWVPARLLKATGRRW
ncbi:hypothetical protein [Streptomyces sp. UG1]|uniref:hypothetical protein n=1 Tax=Streptomyces sp. UG1 TaxID=3417652 RepID=UPI003CED0D5B